MAGLDVSKELGIMHQKLIHYGQLRWLNVILELWDRAYRKAYGAVANERRNRRADATIELAVVDKLLGVASVGVQAAFVPVMLGLQQLNGRRSEPIPGNVAATPEDFISDRKLEFGRMLVRCSESILQLVDDRSVSAETFLRFRSRALLSPIWYPPRDPDERELANRIERRLWAKVLLEKGSLTLAADIRDKIASVKLAGDNDKDIDLRKMQDLAQASVAAARRRGGLGDEFKFRELYGPIFKELARPDPLSYPLPRHPQAYVDLVARRTPALPIPMPPAAGRAIAEVSLDMMPYIYLDWRDVPA